MTVTFIWYPKCSTCQKAAKWLNEHGIEHNDRHIVEENPTAAELVESELFLKIVKIVRSSLLNEHEAVERNTVSLCELGAVYADTVSHLIGPAVVSAAHLYDVLMLCSKSRDTSRTHASLGARAHHTEHINGFNAVGNLFGELVLKLVEKSG